MPQPNIALLHGGAQGSWVWNETIAALNAQSAGTANCVALDVPGCGTKRTRDTSAVEFDDIAQELVADLEAASMQSVVLIGHSQAGNIIPRMVELDPKRFTALIYVTCSAPAPGTTLLELIGDCMHGERDDQVGWPADPKTTPLSERYDLMFCNDMTSRQRDEFLANMNRDMWPISSFTYNDFRYDHLNAVRATYVLCLQDMSLPIRWQERFAARLQTGNTAYIDAGHQVMTTQPQALAEILLQNL